LPQKDLQIEFEQFTQLSSGFTNWLKWMTHPSLERRPASAPIAKEVLEKPQEINKYSQTLRQGKTVNTFSLLGNAIWYSTAIGSLGVGISGFLYTTFLGPGWGIITGFQGVCLGLSLGLGNGIIVGIVTRLWFFPLTNPKLYRQVLTTMSIVLCTWISMIFFHARFWALNVGDFWHLPFIIVVLAPSLMAGLSMGASTNSITRWYQKASRL
jgi:hypothetical protein